MAPVKSLLIGGATGQGLLKSNQRRRHAISQASEAGVDHKGSNHHAIDRRSIPAHAVESRWHAADGHAIRRIDWPGAEGGKRGSILFFPGRGDNYEKYLETLEEWHRAGWRVTASDWRGQADSGRLGDDAVTGHVEDFAHWIDDLRHFWSSWTEETPGPHVLAGHSMGGHLVLRGVVDGAANPDAVVLSAPMLGFVGNILPIGFLHAVAAKMVKFRGAKTPAWKWSEKPGETPAGRVGLLTHDPDRYADELWWREHRPELVMGPGSWGWVERAYESMRGMYEPGVLEAVQTPVLLLGAEKDKLVAFKAIANAAERLPKGELVRFGADTHHEILREVDAVRDRAQAAISEFLDRVAPVS